MARELKRLMVKELERKFRDIGQTGCIVVMCGPLKGETARNMRRQIRQMGAEVTVVKNALFSLAMENLGVRQIGELLDGPSAIVRAENAVLAAKAARDAAEDYDAVTILGGYMEGKLLDARGVTELASLPSREELLSILLGQAVSPARRLVACLLAGPQNLLNCLEQLGDRMAEQAAA